MKNHDPMGDRLKAYEKLETSRRCDPSKPICVRLDGRAFHTFTRGLNRPYDERLSRLMIDTTKFLVGETHAKIGYTQSDEITLIYVYEDGSQPIFGGKLHKLTSLLAGMCSAKFASILKPHLPSKMKLYTPRSLEEENYWADSIPCFDARVFQVPTKDEAANVLLWRWFDAKKNSIAMLAQSLFSHKELQNKDGQAMAAMCLEKGHDWNEYPDFFKWGTFIQRKTVERELTVEELSKIPVKHWPTGSVLRSKIEELAMPPFVEVMNRVAVIFEDTPPKATTVPAH